MIPIVFRYMGRESREEWPAVPRVGDHVTIEGLCGYVNVKTVEWCDDDEKGFRVHVLLSPTAT